MPGRCGRAVGPSPWRGTGRIRRRPISLWIRWFEWRQSMPTARDTVVSCGGSRRNCAENGGPPSWFKTHRGSPCYCCCGWRGNAARAGSWTGIIWEVPCWPCADRPGGTPLAFTGGANTDSLGWLMSIGRSRPPWRESSLASERPSCMTGPPWRIEKPRTRPAGFHRLAPARDRSLNAWHGGGGCSPTCLHPPRPVGSWHHRVGDQTRTPRRCCGSRRSGKKTP